MAENFPKTFVSHYVHKLTAELTASFSRRVLQVSFLTSAESIIVLGTSHRFMIYIMNISR